MHWSRSQVPTQVPLDRVKVTLNGKNISAAFSIADASKRTLRALVTGLRVGDNLLRVDADTRRSDLWGWLHGYDDDATLVVTNHPRGGPVILGSQTQPWVCATPAPVPASGNTPASNASGLTTIATDAQCNIATEYKLFYRTTTAACSTALPDPSPPARAPSPTTPHSASSPTRRRTTTRPIWPPPRPRDGLTVPYIVRVERGTLNRGIYDIAVLFDPAKPWTALAPQAQWNGKIVHSFGASTGHTRLQNRSTQNWSDHQALSRGFMVVDHSLTDSINNSNRVLVAETVMMLKELITDQYGEIKYLMGNGCSGGSIQQNTVASIFPGLLDGLQPACTYPDSITTAGGRRLRAAGQLLRQPRVESAMAGKTQAEINAKKTAINGHLDHVGCQSWNNAFGFANQPGNFVRKLVLDQVTGAMGVIPGEAPRNNCNLPAALVYDPVTNPTAVRCSDPDNAAVGVGHHRQRARRRAAQRALQTADNTGIQYGLGALKSGAITAEEFVLLNERIGGTDNDSKLRPQRTTADLDAVRTAYRAGVVSSGERLGRVAIIDSRGYDESGIHYIWRTYSERARIEEANQGNHGNQVIWRYGTGLAAGHGGAGRRGHGGIVPHDGHLAHHAARQRAEGLGQRRAHAVAGDRGQAGRPARPVLSHGRPRLRDTDHRHGVVRCRPAADEARLAAPGGRRPADGEHPQVPAQADRQRRLRAGHVDGRATRAPACRVPRGCVRLEQARHPPAAGALADDVRRRTRRQAAAAASRSSPLAVGRLKHG